MSRVSDVLLPVSFYFRLNIVGAAGSEDVAFRQVTGLETAIGIETVVEGGENRFVHRLPTSVKHPSLVLKQGIASTTSELIVWFESALQSGLALRVTPRNLEISLCDAEGDPILTWTIGDAFPVKWQISGFHAVKDEIAVETMELAYDTLKRMN